MLRVAPLLILLTGAPEATAKEPRRNPLGVRDSRRQLSTASDKLVVDADGLVDRVSDKATVKPSKGASHGDKKLLFSSIVIPPSPPEYECDAGACPSPPITSLHARFSAQLLCAHSSAHTPLRTRSTPAHWRTARASLRPRSVASPLTPLVCVSRPAAAASSRCFTASLTIPPSPQSASSCARTQSTQSSA